MAGHWQQHNSKIMKIMFTLINTLNTGLHWEHQTAKRIQHDMNLMEMKMKKEEKTEIYYKLTYSNTGQFFHIGLNIWLSASPWPSEDTLSSKTTANNLGCINIPMFGVLDDEN